MPDAKRIKRLFDLSLEEWQQVFDYQEGRCAICKRPMNKPNVDHCHTTGAVRGLLCWKCNRALGVFRDSLILLRAALAYLENFPVTLALGYPKYGLPGRVDTKKQRKLARKMKKDRLTKIENVGIVGNGARQ